MIAIRTAGVVVAAGLIVGCQQRREQPRVVEPEPAPMQAAEELRQSLVRANPDARVGIVAATVGRFAAVREVPAGNVAEGATVQILDPDGQVLGYGLVRAVKEDSIHVLYQNDTRRGPEVGDLVMPASDAGVPVVEEMPAAQTMQPAEPAEPSLLPPRRSAAEPDAAPAEAAPAEQPAAQPEQPAPSPQEETPPGDFQPTQPGDDRATLPPVDGATDAPAPALDAGEPAPDADEPAPDADEPAPQPSPGDTNNAAAEPAPAPAPAEPAPQADEAPAPAPEADEEQAPEAETPGLNK